ncbi:hypothetical protein ACEPAH_4138 [Sanghuangporus vaninii]
MLPTLKTSDDRKGTVALEFFGLPSTSNLTRFEGALVSWNLLWGIVLVHLGTEQWYIGSALKKPYLHPRNNRNKPLPSYVAAATFR